MNELIYLDNNGTTPIDEQVIEIINQELAESWGNPSSDHLYGQKAKHAIDKARLQIAKSIGLSDLKDEREIIFTSGGTESINWVLHSHSQNQSSSHFITSGLEHCAINNYIKNISCEHFSYSIVNPPKLTFHINPEDIISEVKENTRLICVMLANNETGAIQPVKTIGLKIKEINKSRDVKIKFLVDASQCLGKVKFDVKDLNCDFCIIAGHKFYGPRIGALYCADPSDLKPMILGGGQENGMRAGTENTPMIAGLGAAAEIATINLDSNSRDMKRTRDHLLAILKNIFVKVQWIAAEPVLPNTLLVHIPNSRHEIVPKLKQLVIFSTGAACHSGASFSSVLTASGISAEIQSNVIRFSTGKHTTIEDIERVGEILKGIISEKV